MALILLKDAGRFQFRRRKLSIFAIIPVISQNAKQENVFMNFSLRDSIALVLNAYEKAQKGPIKGYILYGILFLFLFLGLLFNVVKRLGSSKNFPPPKDKKEEWFQVRKRNIF